MSRQFQLNQEVEITNNGRNAINVYAGRQTVVRGYHAGQRYPYVLANGLHVTAKELKSIEETAIVEGLPESINPVLITAFDYAAAAEKAINPEKGDIVKVCLAPTPELHEVMNFNHDKSYYWGYSSDTFIGENCKVTGTTKSGGFLFLQLEHPKSGSTQYFPMFLVKFLERKSPALFRTNGSEDYQAIIFKDHVEIRDEDFSFELFDKLTEAIKERKTTGRTSTFTISSRWTGHLHDTYIKVGCQTFYYKEIRRLMVVINHIRGLQK